MFGGDKVMLDFDRTYDKVIADRYIEDLYFYNSAASWMSSAQLAP